MYTVSFFFWFNKRNTFTPQASFNVPLLKQVSHTLCLRFLYLPPVYKISAFPPACLLSQLLQDFLVYGHTHLHTNVYVCICIDKHNKHTCVKKYWLGPGCLEPSLRQGFWCMDVLSKGSQGKGRRRRRGREGAEQGLGSAAAQFHIPRGAFCSMNCSTQWVLPEARGPTFVPLLVSRGLP